MPLQCHSAQTGFRSPSGCGWAAWPNNTERIWLRRFRVDRLQNATADRHTYSTALRYVSYLNPHITEVCETPEAERTKTAGEAVRPPPATGVPASGSGQNAAQASGVLVRGGPICDYVEIGPLATIIRNTDAFTFPHSTSAIHFWERPSDVCRGIFPSAHRWTGDSDDHLPADSSQSYLPLFRAV